MSETIHIVPFIGLSLALIVGVLCMLNTKYIMRAGYWLLEVCIVSAGLFYVLDANYLALVQLLVYAGAVSILVVFTIVMTDRNRKTGARSRDLSRIAFFIAILFCVGMFFVIRGIQIPFAKLPEHAPSLVDFGQILFSPTHWALPFEIASLVLIVALVAAVWWSRKDEE